MTQEIWNPVVDEMAKLDVGCSVDVATFDFTGHGETTTTMTDWPLDSLDGLVSTSQLLVALAGIQVPRFPSGCSTH